jgi:hypothetical protein
VGINLFLIQCGFKGILDFNARIPSSKISETLAKYKESMKDENSESYKITRYINAGYNNIKYPRFDNPKFETEYLQFVRDRIKSFYDISFYSPKNSGHFIIKSGRKFQYDIYRSKKFIINGYCYTGLGRDELYNKQLIDMCLDKEEYKVDPSVQKWIDLERAAQNTSVEQNTPVIIPPVQKIEVVESGKHIMNMPASSTEIVGFKYNQQEDTQFKIRWTLASEDVAPVKSDEHFTTITAIEEENRKITRGGEILQEFAHVPRDEKGRFMPTNPKDIALLNFKINLILPAMYPNMNILVSGAVELLFAPGYYNCRLTDPKKYRELYIEQIVEESMEGDEEDIISVERATKMYELRAPFFAQEEENDRILAELKLQYGNQIFEMPYPDFVRIKKEAGIVEIEYPEGAY